MVEITTLTIKTRKEAGVVSVVDRIHVENKKQEDSNKGTQFRILISNARNVKTNTARIIYNLDRQRTRFAQNAPNEGILQ